jgi:hypothetical protein
MPLFFQGWPFLLSWWKNLGRIELSLSVKPSLINTINDVLARTFLPIIPGRSEMGKRARVGREPNPSFYQELTPIIINLLI